MCSSTKKQTSSPEVVLFVNGVCIAEALDSALSRCPESICEAVSGEMVSVKIGEDRLPTCCLESILEGSVVGRVRVRAS